MNRMRELREERKMNMKEAAACLHMPYTTYVNYEKGSREPGSETLIQIAELYGVSVDYLIGKSGKRAPAVPPGFEPLPETDRVPRVGKIACGDPILAEENIEDYDSVPSAWRASFTLRCKGDSMEPRIKDGDLVAIRRQPTVENGEIAAVRIGSEATLKHVYVYEGYVELRPENPAYESIIKIGEAMNEVQIEGRAVGLCRGL